MSYGLTPGHTLPTSSTAEPEALPASEPSLQVPAVHDSEDENDALLGEDVVHHPEIAHPKTVKRIGDSTDGFRALAATSARKGNLDREALQRPTDRGPIPVREPLELTSRRPGQAYLERLRGAHPGSACGPSHGPAWPAAAS